MMAMAKPLQQDWQLNRSVLECNEYMYCQQVSCDVSFHVEHGDSDTVDIPAHKYVLISRSPVFYAMFCGELAEETNTIKIEDIDPKAFKEMLRFIYCEKVQLNTEMVLSVLYAAKKYMLPSLSKRCTEFMERNINEDTVCMLLEQSAFFGEDKLQQKCLSYIQRQADAVMKSDSFSKISHQTLVQLLECDKLSANELAIFKACITWSVAEIDRQGLSNTPDNQRKVLDTALQHIHFPSMPLKDFANVVVKSRILTTEETSLVFEYLTCDEKPVVPFPTQKRNSCSQLISCKLYHEVYWCSQNYVSFEVPLSCTKDIHLGGVKVFAHQPRHLFSSVRLMIKRKSNVLCDFTIKMDTVFSDEESNDILSIMLPEAVSVPAGKFTIAITYNERDTWVRSFYDCKCGNPVNQVRYGNVIFRVLKDLGALAELIFHEV